MREDIQPSVTVILPVCRVNDYSYRPQAYFVTRNQGRAGMLPAGSHVNEYSYRPQAFSFDATNGGQHTRPPFVMREDIPRLAKGFVPVCRVNDYSYRPQAYFVTRNQGRASGLSPIAWAKGDAARRS
jgi:hypothetical protein